MKQIGFKMMKLEHLQRFGSHFEKSALTALSSIRIFAGTLVPIAMCIRFIKMVVSENPPGGAWGATVAHRLFRIRNTGTIMFLARLFGCYDVINDVILNVPYYLHVQVIWHTVLCLWEKIRKFKNSFLCSKTHLWHVYNVKMPNWTRNESNLNLIIFSIKLHTPFHITCTLTH